MKVNLLFFAVLRDVTGTDAATLDLSPGATPRTIWSELRKAHPRLAGYEHPPLVAVNETYAGLDEPVRDGDVVAFIPPVSGG